MNQKISLIIDFLLNYLQGKRKAIELSLITLLSNGHLLIEDLPGLGKTTLAIGLAKTLGLSFGRVQATSDLLPSDITGLSVFNKNSGEFEFHPGPIFNNILLVDEINRATPKTQSALLEAMAERQVTIDGKTYDLPKPFFVIATQNPYELFGTFPLPESQLDRFMMKISLGYPEKEELREILRIGSTREELIKINPILSKDEIIKIQETIKSEVYISTKVIDYIIEIVEATKRSKFLYSGISTRGSLSLLLASKANAFIKGRDYVIPEDVKELIEYIIPHRVLFKEEYENTNKKEIIKSIIEEVPTPV